MAVFGQFESRAAIMSLIAGLTLLVTGPARASSGPCFYDRLSVATKDQIAALYLSQGIDGIRQLNISPSELDDLIRSCGVVGINQKYAKQILDTEIAKQSMSADIGKRYGLAFYVLGNAWGALPPSERYEFREWVKASTLTPSKVAVAKSNADMMVIFAHIMNNAGVNSEGMNMEAKKKIFQYFTLIAIQELQDAGSI